MTRKIDAINTVSPSAYIEIHPDDANILGVPDGEMVKVSSKRGSIDIRVSISGRPSKGMVFMPFHFKEAAANVLDKYRSRPGIENTRVEGVCGKDRTNRKIEIGFKKEGDHD